MARSRTGAIDDPPRPTSSTDRENQRQGLSKTSPSSSEKTGTGVTPLVEQALTCVGLPCKLLDSVDSLSRTKVEHRIKNIYVNYKSRVDTSPIGDLSRHYLSSAYATHVLSLVGILVCLATIYFGSIDGKTGVFILATLPPAQFKESRWAIVARVSDPDQLDNTSMDKQLSRVRDRASELDGQVVREFSNAESGADMDRDSLEEVLEMAQNDKYDILGVWKLDRLTRSDPRESIRYLYQLRETDVVLYSDSHGFFDWEDRNDFEIIVREIIFARQWYSRIKENAEDGQLDLLEEGRYPFGEPHFGYEKDSDDNLHLTDQGEEIIPDIFEVYLDSKNRAETRRQINQNLPQDEQLTDSQVKTILESPLCVGQLTLRDNLVTTDSSLQCVTKRTYNRAQEILEDRRTSTPEGELIPDSIEEANKRFGVEFVGKLFEKFTATCPDCDGELTETNGTTEVRDTHLVEYECGDCEFKGPLFTEEEIRNLDSTLPLGCPLCTSVGQVNLEERTSSTLEYVYKCHYCENKFAVSVPPNKYKRAFENPDIAYHWNDSLNDESSDGSSESPGESEFIWDNAAGHSSDLSAGGDEEMN